MRKVYLILISIAFVSACIQPIDLKKLPAYAEKTVINGSLNNLIFMEFSLSKSAYAYNTSSPGKLKSPIVTLLEDNIPLNVLYDPVNTKYFTNSKPKPGSTYFISVNSENGTAIASATMPSTFAGTSKLVINGGIDQTGIPSDLISISWNDNGSKNNYYKINFFYYSELAKTFIPFSFTTTDQVLLSNETIKTNDGGYIFKDNLFNGKAIKLSAVPSFGLTSPTAPYKYLIQLNNMSEDYYKYLTTLQRFRDAQDFGTGLFTEPIVVFSNINNGLGIWAGSSMTSDTLR
jgi:hypothetical protein